MVWNRAGGDVRRWEWKGKMALGDPLQAASWDLSPSTPSTPASHLQPHSTPPTSPPGAGIMLSTLWLHLASGEPSVGYYQNQSTWKFMLRQWHPAREAARRCVCVCVCIEDLGKQGKRECSSWNTDIRINGQVLGGSAHARELWDARLMDPLSQEGWYTIVSLFRKTERGKRVKQFSLAEWSGLLRSFSGGHICGRNGFSFIMSFEY